MDIHENAQPRFALYVKKEGKAIHQQNIIDQKAYVSR